MSTDPSRAKAVFLAALEKTTPTERAAYLDQACAGDLALRQRVQALLHASGQPDSLLDQPAAAGSPEPSPDPATRTVPGATGDFPAKSDPALAFLGPPREPGTLGRLDHYEVLDVAGRGGMGVVLKARDTKLQRVVALKVLAPHLAASGSARQRFVREAQAAAAVRDDHVVAIHAVEDGPVPYLVMEFIAGVTLDERVKADGALPVKEVLRIGLQAAKGLAAAHAQGLIHRDVKPGNILLENGVQRVKIADFGLARAAEDERLTRDGALAGTPLYMSPEQARGERLSPRSDLFSLGSVLHTLCAGRPAFRAENALAVMKRVCEDTPRPLREVNPDVPDWLAAVVEKLLAKDPAERYQSAAEVAEVLGRHLAQLQRPDLTPVPAPPPAGPPSQAQPRRKKVGMAVLLLASVGAVAVLGCLALLGRTWLFPPPADRAENPQAQEVGPTPPGQDRGKLGGPGKAGVADDPRVLTVSQKPEDGGRFRTIQEALDAVKPGMTIRVLDDVVYEESLLLSQRSRHANITLDAPRQAILRAPTGVNNLLEISGVEGVTLRGFRLRNHANGIAAVYVHGHSPGVVLECLDFADRPGLNGIDIEGAEIAPDEAPIVVQQCHFRHVQTGVAIIGWTGSRHPQLVAGVSVRLNTFENCNRAIILGGKVSRVQVVGNRIQLQHRDRA